MPFVAVNGMSVFYEELGSGPGLVLIHGGTVDSSMWRGQIALELGMRYPRVARALVVGAASYRFSDSYLRIDTGMQFAS